MLPHLSLLFCFFIPLNGLAFKISNYYFSATNFLIILITLLSLAGIKKQFPKSLVPLFLIGTILFLYILSTLALDQKKYVFTLTLAFFGLVHIISFRKKNDEFLIFASKLMLAGCVVAAFLTFLAAFDIHLFEVKKAAQRFGFTARVVGLPISYGIFGIIMILGMSLAIFLHRINVISRLSMLGFTMLFLFTVLITQSRSFLLAVFIGLLVLLFNFIGLKLINRITARLLIFGPWVLLFAFTTILDLLLPLGEYISLFEQSTNLYPRAIALELINDLNFGLPTGLPTVEVGNRVFYVHNAFYNAQAVLGIYSILLLLVTYLFLPSRLLKFRSEAIFFLSASSVEYALFPGPFSKEMIFGVAFLLIIHDVTGRQNENITARR